MTKNSSIKEKLLKDIKSGSVHMTPRAFFMLKIVATILVTTAVVITTLLIFNFLFFSIRISNTAALLHFGERGLVTFLHFFPWPLLALDIVFLLILQRLLRQFRFAYSVPMLYLLVLLIALSALFGYMLDQVRLNDFLERSRHFAPPVGAFYDGARRPPPKGSGICRCTIIDIVGDTLIVEDTREKSTSTMTVILPANNTYATSTSLKVGDVIYIAGDEKEGVINAFGIRKERARKP